MADWGALAQGLSRGIGNPAEMMLGLSNLKRKQAEDKKEADLKAAHMYMGVMSNDAFSDEIKIKAQNNFADL